MSCCEEEGAVGSSHATSKDAARHERAARRRRRRCGKGRARRCKHEADAAAHATAFTKRGEDVNEGEEEKEAEEAALRSGLSTGARAAARAAHVKSCKPTAEFAESGGESR
jgi:hypothetical protein